MARRSDRKGFDCGERSLNDFLYLHARQSHERGGAKIYVAVDSGDGKTVGCYSLSPASIEYARVPETMTGGLGRYDVGAYRLSRLAVCVAIQGQGMGGLLLLAAGRRCLRVAEEAGGNSHADRRKG